MSITAIGNASNTLASQLQAVTANPFVSSSSTDGATPGTVPTGGGESRFVSAIKNAFESLGLSLDGSSSTTATASATGTSSTGDASSSSDAVASFLQSLLAALHGQSAANGPPAPPADDAASATTATAATSATSATDPTASSASTTTASGDATSAANGTPAAHHHHGHGGGGRIDGDLKSLIAQLQSSDGSTTDGTTTPGTVASTTWSSGDTALATLEKNFDALLAQNGVASTGGTGQLTAFLEKLASGLDGAPATGNVVSTTA